MDTTTATCYNVSCFVQYVKQSYLAFLYNDSIERICGCSFYEVDSSAENDSLVDFCLFIRMLNFAQKAYGRDPVITKTFTVFLILELFEQVNYETRHWIFMLWKTIG